MGRTRSGWVPFPAVTRNETFANTSYRCPVWPYRGPYGTRPSTSYPSATLLAVRESSAPEIQHEHWLHTTILPEALGVRRPWALHSFRGH